MKHPLRTALFFIFTVLLVVRLLTLDWQLPHQNNILTWDSFGYYLYLPGNFIYHDLDKLAWLPQIVETYHPTPHLYQVIALPNGNFAMKYLMGLSILYLPFFALGHVAAGWTGFPQDGFSLPYQLSICLGALVYAVAGLWILGKVLRRFFSETTAAVALLLVALASNFPEYTAVQAGQTHGWLFALYALQIWLTLRWHEQPTLPRSFFIGWLLGLATITRPTEGVMLFIPLLWQAKNFNKWEFIRRHPLHLVLAGGGLLLGVLPQLIYWKTVTGNWVFDVGSKWYFLNPWWRVLFGWEKGWFIYTPIAIFMVAGLFLMKNRPFKTAVLTFFLLNTWIIISWADWRYGGSYSTRALLQGYAVLALPLALVVERAARSRWKIPAAALGVFLIGLNLFQIWQFQRTILHYNDNNFAYYRAVFLDPNPTPLDMSLLDTRELLQNETGFSKTAVFSSGDSIFMLSAKTRPQVIFWQNALEKLPPGSDRWLHVSAEVKSDWGAFGAHLRAEILQNGIVKKATACRLENGICRKGEWNRIEFYFKISREMAVGEVRISTQATGEQVVYLKEVQAKWLVKN